MSSLRNVIGLVFVFLGFCFNNASGQKDLNCPAPFVPFNISGRCYFVSNNPLTYPWAVEMCETLKSEVYVSNFEERNTIHEYITHYLSFKYYWIGVHKVIANYSNLEGWWVYQNNTRLHYYPWDYTYKVKPENEWNRTIWQGNPYKMAMYLRDLMYLSGWTDRGAEPSFWEKIQETLSRQFFDVSVTPGARLWNFPYWSGGGGLRWDQAYDNTGWGGHPFHPLGSRRFNFCAYEFWSNQGAVWAPINCWGVKLGVVCVRDPLPP